MTDSTMHNYDAVYSLLIGVSEEFILLLDAVVYSSLVFFTPHQDSIVVETEQVLSFGFDPHKNVIAQW